ncbi:hypothetical protein MTO96_020813 [Rhipicephalus appendiculatus]
MNAHQAVQVLFLLCAVLCSFTGTANAEASVETASTTVAPSPTKRLEADFAEVTRALASKFVPTVSDLIGDRNLSVACSSSVVKLLQGLRNKDAWAMKMLLSNGLLPINIFEGGQVSLGSYEQCLHTVNREGQTTLKGQYCSLHFRMPHDLMSSIVDSFHKIGELVGRKNPLTRTVHNKFASIDYRIGICTPSTCTTDDLQVLATKMLGQYGITSTVRSCRTDSPKTISLLQAVSMAVLGALALSVVVATLTEWIMEARRGCNVKCQDGTALGTLLYFSALSNTRYLLSVENTEKNRPLLFLGGFKVLLMLWVIYGHSYVIVQLEFADNLFNIADVQKKVLSQIIPNGFLSVSTFLYLSGFALTFSLLSFRQSLYQKNVLIVFIIGCCKRYLRLTLPIVGVILGTFLLPLLVDGPADQDFVASEVQGCISNWWTVFVYSNNFNPLNDIVIQTVLWLLSIGLSCFVMFVTVYWNQGNAPNDVVNALYGGCHRLLWSLALAWPSFACATGRGGILNGFLSWKSLRPLSRLTYCIYLVHSWFFLIRMGNMRTNFELSEYTLLMTSLGIFCYSAFFGYVLHLCCEAPAYHLQRILFDTSTSSKPSQKKSDDLSTTEVGVEKAGSESTYNGDYEKKVAIDNAGFVTDAEKSRL